MSTETLRITLTSGVLHQYLDKIDARDESYEFVAYREPHDTALRPAQTPLRLNLQREGEVDPLMLTLYPDGTWKAEHQLVLGEKL